MMNSRLILLHVCLAVMCDIVESSCVFENQVRALGEIWHPTTFGTCVNCTCQLGTQGEPEVRCVNTVDKCPKLTCDTPKKDPNMCCPYCEDIPNIPPTVQTGEEKSSSSAKASCTTPDGRTFKDGEKYSSNRTGLKPTSDNQCVMCVCQNGQALCHLKTCAAPKSCSAFIEVADTCCPACADCAHADGVKLNGTTWHPTIASIGEIECITCSCKNGEIKCRKDCLPDHELPCRHPKKPNGECCKTCPLVDSETGEKSRKDKRKDRKDRKGKNKKKGRRRRKKCRDKNKKDKKDRKCRRKKRKRPRKRDNKEKPEALVQSVTSAPGVDLDTLCLKRRTQFLMYKVQTGKEMSIGFDDIKANAVDIYKWTINKTTERELVSYGNMTVVASPEYRRSLNNTNVIGTIGNKQYKKFKKRLKDKLEKCIVDCDPKLFIRIVQRVKVHLLKFGNECRKTQ